MKKKSRKFENVSIINNLFQRLSYSEITVSLESRSVWKNLTVKFKLSNEITFLSRTLKFKGEQLITLGILE